MTNPLKELLHAGQSFWLDYIDRDLIRSGELGRMVAEDGLRGVTSNPSIFDKAIDAGSVYDDAIRTIVDAHPDVDAESIFKAVAVDDIRDAADVLRPVFVEAEGNDGFVSLEVSPHLAHDTGGTVREAQELFQRVDRPNVMIKVPATPAGLPAIETLIGSGVNVNVTLLFSVARYTEVIEAYLRGLESRSARNERLDTVASVASFFVSRVDTLVDRLLETRAPGPETRSQVDTLRGQAAIANAKLAYAELQSCLTSERFQLLQGQGARIQRLLWGSTSTKNPDYPHTMYVDTLIGPHTVNTMPPETVALFREHGRVTPALGQGLDEAHRVVHELSALGIDLEEVAAQLESEGVQAFADAYDHLMASIRDKAGRLKRQAGTTR